MSRHPTATRPSAKKPIASEPAWLRRWPVAYPHPKKPWTVRNDDGWGVLKPEQGEVVPVDPICDRRLPGIGPALRSGKLLGYRSQRRAIVATSDRYIKVVRPSRAADLVANHEYVVEAGLTIATPEVLAVSDDGRVTLSTVNGHSLHQLIRALDPRADSAPASIQRLAEALAEFHRITPTKSHSVKPTTAESPDTASNWAGLVERAEPELGRRLRSLAKALLTPDPADLQRSLIHGDLHDKNVLFDGDRVGFVDLDGLAVGLAEDDVANLGVHLQLRTIQQGRGLELGRRWADCFYESYNRNHQIDRGYIDLVERQTWFRLACLYRYRRNSRALMPVLLQLAVGNSGR